MDETSRGRGQTCELVERLRSLACGWQKHADETEVPDSLDPEVVGAAEASSTVRRNCAFQLDEVLDEVCPLTEDASDQPPAATR